MFFRRNECSQSVLHLEIVGINASVPMTRAHHDCAYLAVLTSGKQHLRTATWCRFHLQPDERRTY